MQKPVSVPKKPKKTKKKPKKCESVPKKPKNKDLQDLGHWGVRVKGWTEPVQVPGIKIYGFV